MREIWKDIPGYEGLYQASSFGRIHSAKRSTTKGGMIKTQRHTMGYLSVMLCKNGKTKRYLVHRLIAETFLGPDENGLVVNHKDEDKTNNAVTNLEYITQKENVNYGTSATRRVKHCMVGRKNPNYGNRGAKNRLSKKVAQYDLQGNLIAWYDSVAEAAEKNNLNQSSISKVARGASKHCGGYIWKY